MANLPVAYVFVDANAALHFRRPDEIDWCTFVGANEVVLVGAPVLLRELENQKIVNVSRKLRQRAADYIKWLHPFVRTPEINVRVGVRWLFLPEEPDIDFSSERLSHTISDDHLIASVLHYTRQSKINTFVATADLGLEIKLRTRRINVLELSDDLRLPTERDPLERENRDLKRQLARIQARMPKLSVAFENSRQHHIISIRAADSFTVPSLAQVQADNPYMSRPKSVDRSLQGVGAAFAEIQRLTQPLGMTSERMDAYDNELEVYFREYQDYLDCHAAWRDTLCLHHAIKCKILNDGTAPASNIDLDLFFPEGTFLVNDDDFPKEPDPPKVPRRPQGIVDIRGLQYPNHLKPLISPDFYDVINKNYDGVPIIGNDKDSVRVAYSSLKHGFDFTTDEIVFRFEEQGTVRAFNIGYRLSADELLDIVEGRLHIRIDDTDS